MQHDLNTILTVIVSALSGTGLLGAIAMWFWRLEPRLRALESDQESLREDVDDLKVDHSTRIARNAQEIAELRNTLSRIDERTSHTDRNVGRILDRLDA